GYLGGDLVATRTRRIVAEVEPPPGVSSLAARASSSRAGPVQKRFTLTAKILSKRSVSSPAADRSGARNAAVWIEARPAAMCAALRRLARSAIVADRSIAVMRPVVRRALISSTATPPPHPISSSRPVGSTASVWTAHLFRSGTASPAMIAPPGPLPCQDRCSGHGKRRAAASRPGPSGAGTAGHVQHLSGDERRAFAGEEGDGVGDVLGPADPPHR